MRQRRRRRARSRSPPHRSNRRWRAAGLTPWGGAVFARPNLVAWCIVPFDAKNRTPAERAEMMRRLGIRRFAYDWRDAHLPTFEQELAELKKRDIELTAVWFPASMTPQARLLL